MAQQSVALYKMTDEFLELQDMLLEEGAAWTPEVEEKLRGLSLEIKEKIERILQFAQNLDALADAADTEVKRLQAECVKNRRKSAQRLRDYVLREMKSLKIEKLELATFRPRRVLNSNPLIRPVNPDKFPDVYARIIPEQRVFDAKKAREHLEAAGLMPKEAGKFEVEGVVIERKEHLRK